MNPSSQTDNDPEFFRIGYLLKMNEQNYLLSVPKGKNKDVVVLLAGKSVTIFLVP